MNFEIGDLVWSIEHNRFWLIVDSQILWGEATYRMWLPDRDAIVRIRSDHLNSLDDTSARISSDHINYVSAAGWVADALKHDVLLAPIESSVIPLPHQIKALSQAISNDRVRYLLADEVGLGKTIEAGLIMRKLRLHWLPLVLISIDGERQDG